jgi:hypothetical protein
MADERKMTGVSKSPQGTAPHLGSDNPESLYSGNQELVKMYSFLADALASFHFAYVAFVVAGELAILVGAAFGCRWARNPWFRLLHLLAIAVVAMEAVFHVPCPLTVWENQLRAAAGQASSNETFIGRLVQTVFLNGLWEESVYERIHIGFGLLVFATYVFLPPRFRRLRQDGATAAPTAPVHDMRLGNASPQPTVANQVR